MASRQITMHRCHKPEKTAVRAVSEQMATDFDRVANLEVFALDTDSLKSPMACSFHRPDRWRTVRILDLDINPRMRNEVVDFGNLAFHRRPLCRVVVAVGVMGSNG
jgi:hypothetical protein